MKFESEPFPRFNVGAMSGVFSGTRTERFFRLRLAHKAENPFALYWYQLLIPPEPGVHAPYLLARYRPVEQRSRGQNSPPPAEAGGETEAVQFYAPELLQSLPAQLDALGYDLHACGTCRFWQQQRRATQIEAATGRCTFTPDRLDENLAQEADAHRDQSALALGCIHWRARAQDTPIDGQGTGSAEPTDSALDPGALQPSSTETDSAQANTGSGAIARLLSGLFGNRQKKAPADRPLFGERSGVGAGTEACFACQGRLANLGALVVESPEGDPETYSIWRCRECRSIFLNRWFDRWVRTDSLETDETHFRIAPLEAAEGLAIMRATPNADHPQERQLRTEIGAPLRRLAASADQISRTIKLGR